MRLICIFRSKVWSEPGGRFERITHLIGKMFVCPQHCAYRTDWPWRIIVPLSLPLSKLLRRLDAEPGKAEATPLGVGLTTLFLSITPAVPAIAIALSTDSFLPVSDAEWLSRALLRWMAIAVAIVVAGTVTFSFYQRLFPTFEELNKKGNIEIIGANPAAFSELLAWLECWFNKRFLTPIWATVAVFTLWSLRISQNLATSLRVPFPGVFGYNYWDLVVASVFFCIQFFAWKAVLTFLAIRKISVESSGLRWRPIPMAPDGVGGLSPIASLWLRANAMTVFVGIWIFWWAARSNVLSTFPETTMAYVTLVSIVAYLVGAPLLFFLPLLSVHRALVRHREQPLRNEFLRWREAEDALLSRLDAPLDSYSPSSPSLQELKLRAEERRRLYRDALGMPVWPFNAGILLKFSILYVLPITSNLIVDVAKLLLRFYY